MERNEVLLLLAADAGKVLALLLLNIVCLLGGFALNGGGATKQASKLPVRPPHALPVAQLSMLLFIVLLLLLLLSIVLVPVPRHVVSVHLLGRRQSRRSRRRHRGIYACTSGVGLAHHNAVRAAPAAVVSARRLRARPVQRPCFALLGQRGG